MSDRVVIVLGTPNTVRTLKNPFTISERRTIIYDSLPSDIKDRVYVVHVYDTHDDVSWMENVKTTVRNIVTGTTKFSLFGHHKDESSYYLRFNWAEWDIVDCPMVYPSVHGISSTGIRNILYDLQWKDLNSRDLLLHFPYTFIDENHASSICKFWKSPEFQEQVIEVSNLRKGSIRGSGPFVACDSIVTSKFEGNYYVLLIKRKNAPFKDLWALPGGFLNLGESTLSGAIRELKEETGLVVSRDNLLGGPIVSDDPSRDPRSQVVSIAYRFNLKKMPNVIADDDAIDADWFVIDPSGPKDHMRNWLAFDHFDIITKGMKYE